MARENQHFCGSWPAPTSRRTVRSVGAAVRGVGFLEQVPELFPGTVRAAVGEGWEAEAALSRLGIGPEIDNDVATLSGGQRKGRPLLGYLPIL